MFRNLRNAGVTAIILALAGACAAAEKAGTVSGIVTDELGKPLSGVTWWISAFEEWRDGQWQIVHYSGETRKHTTGEDGRFEVTFYGNGKYDLQFDKWGYGPAFLFQVGSDSSELLVEMKKGVLVTGEVKIEGKSRPDFSGISVVLHLPNPRGLWYKRTTLLDHTGTFQFHATPSPEIPGFPERPQWQLVCAGEVVKLDVTEDAPVDRVIFEIATVSRRESLQEENEASERAGDFRPSSSPAALERTLSQWVADCLKEIQTVKVGMTRKQLLEVFTTEGGLSSRTWRTHVHRRCPYIKVDVEFKVVGNEADKFAEMPEDLITKISRPYLQWPIMD